MRYDSLLILHLALELHERIGGQACTAAQFEREASRFVLVLGKRGESLVWNLQDGRPRIAAAGATEAAPLILPRRAVVSTVSALVDERILTIELAGGARPNAVRSLVIELLPVRGNVIALDADGRVLKQLVRPSAREQVRGQPYAPPRARRRVGADALDLAEWAAALGPEPSQWRARYIDTIAYASPLNAAAVLAEGTTIEAGFARYCDLRRLERAAFRLAEPAGQAYPHHLWQAGARPAPSLLDALRPSPEEGAEPVPIRLEAGARRLTRKIEQLERQAQDARASGARLRADADLLITHAHAVPRGAATVQLEDFEGGQRTLALDPSRSAIDNAQAWYAAARKRERAAERLPQLLAAAQSQLREMQELLRRARAGEPIELPAHSALTRSRRERAVPYRTYRTSGGLEVRVGRNRTANDQLTFQHSGPDDVWLHARDVGGAHVVLRWPHKTENPPRRDLLEAALLAALHSKARHSSTVPVDWTRRRYVRKPRGAGAGQVRAERVETVFVQPGKTVEEGG